MLWPSYRALPYQSAPALSSGLSPHSWASTLVSVFSLCLVSPPVFLRRFQTHPIPSTSFTATGHTPVPQREQANPSSTCRSLALSSHSPTGLPFHQPSHPLTFCLSLTLLCIHLPIFPHVPFTHSSFHKFAYTLIFSSISSFSPPATDRSLHLSAHHPFIHSPKHLPFHPLVLPPSPIHSLIQSLIYSSFNYSFIPLSLC